MDNQQERLAYFAGIIDGEGWVGIGKQKVKRRGRFYDTYVPMISIHMVGQEDVDMLGILARDAGMASYVIHLKSGSSRWTIRGLKRVETALGLLAPYIKIKRQQVALVREFIQSRLSQGQQIGKGWKYTERELEIRNLVCSLNTKGKGKSETEKARILRGHTSDVTA